MSSITRDGVGEGSDHEFERILIASARSDELPHARAEEAWTRLAATLAALPNGSSRPPLERARGGDPVAASAVHGAATKWLLLGALGGGVVTAALMGWGERHRDGRSAPEVTVDAPVVVAPTEPPRHGAVEPSGPTTKRDVRSGTPASPRPGSARRLTATDGEPRRIVERSTLAAEVAALDAARKAGSADETLRLVDRYQYDFPAGELTVDAEVVAMEALAAKGERDELTRRAARFLARYPNDPHAAEVRRLGGR